MANSRRRCAGCRTYFDPETPGVRIGVTSFCSDECFTGRKRAFKREPKPRKSVKARYNSDISTATRQQVLARDNGRCRYCGVQANQLHHIFYRSSGVDNSPNNLICLCLEHHSLVHTNKRLWQPLLLGVIWMTYAGKPMTVPRFQKWLERN